MKKSESQEFTLALMEKTKAVFLATVDAKGVPYIRALNNLRSRREYPGLRGFFRLLENPFVTYLTTFSTSAKAKQIREHPEVALYYCRPEHFFGVMLSGCVATVRDKSIKEALWQEQWECFWPKGPKDPKYRVLRFDPNGARGWSGEEQFRFDI